MGLILKYIRVVLLTLSFFAVSFVTVFLCLFRPFSPKNAKIWSNLFRPLFVLITNAKVDFCTNLAKHPSPCFYVGNHQDEFDTLMYSQGLPNNSVSIGKKSIKWIPFFGQLYVLCGHILIDRSRSSKAYSVLDQVVEKMHKKNLRTIIFPEGTRSKGRGLLKFKQGVFRMAIKSQYPIVPIVISWNYKHLDLTKWNSGRVILKDCEPISTNGLTMDDVQKLSDQTRAVMQAALNELDRLIENENGLLAEAT